MGSNASSQQRHADEMEAPDLYTHLSSDANKPEIRLCLLYPGAFRSQIECSIDTCPFNNELDYEALSYVWGQVNGKSTIKINGEIFPVTKNLEAALRRLRPTSGPPRALWIDALCINQKDVNERSAQVKMMDQIYNKAACVIIWLGEEPATAFEGFQLMLHATRDIYNDLVSSKISEPPKDFPWETLIMLMAGFAQCCNPTRVHDVNPWERTLGIPYFTRSWVVQEMDLARARILQAGALQITLDDLEAFCRFLNHPNMSWFIGEQIGDMAAPDLNIANTCDWVARWSTGSPLESPPLARDIGLDFLRLLASFRDRDSTEPRDKVIAFLGLRELTAHRAQLMPLADYRLTAREIYLTVASIIASSGRAGRMLHVAGTNHSTGKFSLPSWVPDWSFRHTLPRQIQMAVAIDDGEIEERIAQQLFKAGKTGGRVPSVPNKNGPSFEECVVDRAENSASSLALRLQGIKLGQVVGTTMPYPTMDELDMEKWSGFDPVPYFCRCFHTLMDSFGGEVVNWQTFLSLVVDVITKREGYSQPTKFCRDLMSALQHPLDVVDRIGWDDADPVLSRVLGGLQPMVVDHGERRSICLGPAKARAGDGVYVVKHGPKLAVMSKRNDGGDYIYVGEFFDDTLADRSQAVENQNCWETVYLV